MPLEVQRRTLGLAGCDVPVVELTGAVDGPLLTVLAGVHGCEYAPMAAVRRWTRALAQRELRGTVRAVPVLNLPSFRARTLFVVVRPGEQVAEGQLLGTVSTLDGAEVLQEVTAPSPGVPMFITSSPAVAADGLLLGLGAT